MLKKKWEHHAVKFFRKSVVGESIAVEKKLGLDDYYFYECDEAVEQVVSRASEMTSLDRIKIFIGTWNVNGGKNMHNVAFRNQSNMADWIFPNGTLGT
ncbi:hypothetical protein TELCIR_06154 [Teladorsagia circumcincta]|uniref:Endonuclease/exonuclease/phosphatase domain-containing protein n=1 Tax=Teladorsagia circumcincta TaxID=45464 RepID=A0A2G9UP40_TELCI|nr:hypothetical protein TELCIR_06154 [Teladorsagia circumcincta]